MLQYVGPVETHKVLLSHAVGWFSHDAQSIVVLLDKLVFS